MARLTRIWLGSVIDQWLRATGRLMKQKAAGLEREAATVSEDIETVAKSATKPGAEVVADEDVLSGSSDAEARLAGQPAPAQADQDWNIHKIPKGIKLVREDVTREGILVLFEGKPVGRVSHDKASGLWTASKSTGAQATFATRILCTNFLAPASTPSNFETYLRATRDDKRPEGEPDRKPDAPELRGRNPGVTPPPAYPAGLEPLTTTTFEIDDAPVEVPTTRLEFSQGRQDMLAHTFGGKGVVLYGGEPMFAELALRQMCVGDGWQARWLSTYGAAKMRPNLYAGWDPKLHRREQTSDWFYEGLPAYEVLDSIARERGSYVGCWDVVAWTSDRCLFIESKQRGKDAVRRSQKAWLGTALRLGISLDHFLLAEWAYSADQPFTDPWTPIAQ